MPLFLSQIRSLLAGRAASPAHPGGAKHRVEREPREALTGAVIYRPKDGLVWYEGSLVDLSKTGILFRGEKHLPTESPIELSFTLQQASGRRASAPTFCWGKVARTTLPDVDDARPAIAARILRYRGGPQAALEIRKLVGEVRGPMSA